MRRCTRIFTLVLPVLLLGVRPGGAQPHLGDILVGSTVDRGGALVAVHDFERSFPLSLSLAGSTSSFFTNTDPGFESLATPLGQAGPFPLRPSTTVQVEIVSLAPGASLKIDNNTLTAAGQSASIGTTPGIHKHPQWRLTLPNGTTGEFRLSFRLTTTSRFYASSPVYEIRLTNGSVMTVTPTLEPTEVPSPTPTSTRTSTVAIPPTATASATPTPLSDSCFGDCDGSGEVQINDVVTMVNIALGARAVDDCAIGDGDDSGQIEIHEIVRAVGAILQGQCL